MMQNTLDTFVDNLIDSHGIKNTLDIVARASGFESTPPTMKEFIDDNNYLGEMLSGDKIYPFWRSALYEIYPNPFFSPYLEIITTGAIGQGKSTFCLAGVAYDICKLLHLKDPHSKYKIIKSDKIVLALMNATMGLAGTVLFDQIYKWFQESPYFRRELRKSTGRTMFPKSITITSGSRSSHFLGQAVFATILSEINFQNKIADQAAENYNGIRQRIQSRFQTDSVNYPGRMWIDSSKTDSGSFIDDFLLKDRLTEDLQKIRVFDNPRWKVLPPWKLRLSGDTFKVFIGDQFKDPFIIERANQVIGLDDSKILDVPSEFAAEFRLDLFKSLQDIAGISTQAKHKFISSTEKIEESFTHENPVHKEVISTDFNDRDDKLINYIDFSKIPDDQRPRFVHIDLGLVNDKTGIAFTRLDGVIESSQFDSSSGQYKTIHEPVFRTDMIMCIEARSGQEVPIYKIKNLLIDLRARKYPIVMVSTDGYQSAMLRQDLELEMFETKLLSLDRTIDGYVEFKNAILTSRWRGPVHPILATEIRQLELSNGKVDHPIKGSKDISDAVAGSIYLAKSNMMRFRANTTSVDVISAISSMTKPTNFYEELLGRRVS